MSENGRKLILLAEDDPHQRELLQEVLEYEGYQVLVASEPAEVLAQLSRGPEVLLLDVEGVTSPEVTRALDSSRRPAVLLVSADPRLPAIARALGADGYVCKPVELEALLQIVRALSTRRSKGPAPRALPVAPFDG